MGGEAGLGVGGGVYSFEVGGGGVPIPRSIEKLPKSVRRFWKMTRENE